MDYVNSLISEWMPGKDQRVAVDSHPRLSGIMDTINATSAHGEETKLPAQFYDQRGRAIMDKITMEEWFSGFRQSREYRELGIGSLIGDIVARMVNNSEGTMEGGRNQVESQFSGKGTGDSGDKAIKFAMSGCHDSTIAAILSSLGAFEGEKWPPYTSHVAIELFKQEIKSSKPLTDKVVRPGSVEDDTRPRNDSTASMGIARKKVDNLTPIERHALDGFYVRIRYNDRPIVVPGCKLQGKHLPGNETFCTLVGDSKTTLSTRLLITFRRLSSPLPTNLRPEIGRKHAYPSWINLRYQIGRNPRVIEYTSCRDSLKAKHSIACWLFGADIIFLCSNKIFESKDLGLRF